MSAHDVDVLIVGGGIAGFSLAAVLGDLPGDRTVAVLEAEREFGRHTSGRSASQLQPSYGPPAVRAKTRATIARVRELEQEHGRALLRPRPLVWFDQPGERHVERMTLENPALRALSVEEAVALVPLLRPDAVAAAAIDEESFEVDVRALMAVYRERAERAGAEFVTAAGVRAAERAGGRWHVRTEAGDWSARVIVDAAGAWADEVAERFGVPARGLTPYRRTVALIGAGDLPRLAAMASRAGGGLYFRPYGEHELLCSLAEEVPDAAGDARPRETDLTELGRRLATATTIEEPEFTRSWTGLRTFAPDRTPIVGAEPGTPSFVWLAGQGGYGIQTSWALASDAARDIQAVAAA